MYACQLNCSPSLNGFGGLALKFKYKRTMHKENFLIRTYMANVVYHSTELLQSLLKILNTKI